MKREFTGFHALALILGFFGVTIAVNSVFITYALSTFSGEDVSTPYQRGLEYNKTLEARAAQSALKWTASIDVAREAGTDALIVVSISGADGAPLSGLDVAATLRRPTDAKLDRTVVLEPMGNGSYRGVAKGVAAGQWDVIARTTASGGSAFEAERRILLR
jgi:nitrogen fixation protein FixH